MVNIKRGLLFLIFVFLIPAVFASSYDEWLLAGNNISFDDTVFTTAINERWDIATIGFDSELFLIGKGSCQASVLYRVCFRDVRWDIKEGYGTYDPITEIKVPELKITIATLTPTIAITRTIDKTDFLLNDEARISVVVENQGEQKVYDLEYRDVIPREFVITEMKGVTSSGNTIQWSWPSLAADRSFSYKIKLIKPVNASWKASLGYVFESKSLTKDTSSITVKKVEAPNPLTVTTSLSDSKIKIGESVTYKVTLTNTDTKNEVDVDELIVDIPKKVQIKDYGLLEKVDNRLKWSGKLSSEGSKVFDIKLRCDYTGEHKINSSVTNSFYNNIERETFTRTKELSNTLNSYFVKLVPSIKFMFDRTTLDYGDKSNVRAFIENKDSKTPLFEVKYKVKSELFDDFESTLEYIVPGQKVEAFYFPFTAPSLLKYTVYDVEFSGRYRTAYYEYFDFSTEGSVKVKNDPNAVVEEQQTGEAEVETEEVETEAELNETTSETDVNKTTNASMDQDVSVEEVKPEQPQTQKQENFFVKFFRALADLIRDLF